MSGTFGDPGVLRVYERLQFELVVLGFLEKNDDGLYTADATELSLHNLITAFESNSNTITERQAEALQAAVYPVTGAKGQ